VLGRGVVLMMLVCRGGRMNSPILPPLQTNIISTTPLPSTNNQINNMIHPLPMFRWSPFKLDDWTFWITNFGKVKIRSAVGRSGYFIELYKYPDLPTALRIFTFPKLVIQNVQSSSLNGLHL
jgi:hypothetical protein